MQNFKLYYQVISCFFFSLLGLQIKIISENQNIETIVFYRSLFGIIFIVLLSLLLRKKLSKFLVTKNLKIHFLRAIFGMSAMYFGYKALTLITLSQASTIGFTKVFFTTLIATYFFKERISVWNIILILAGFSGVYMICLPSDIIDKAGLCMSLFSALCVSGGIISISYLSKRDDTLIIIFFHSIISCIGFLIIFVDDINFKLENNFLDITLITLTALLGQFFNAESYKVAQTNQVIIMSYTRIFFSTILGFWVFDEEINPLTILGILIIIVTSYFVKTTIKKI